MPSTELRQTILTAARRIVVKMGTQILTGSDGKLDLAFLNKMAGQIAALIERGYEITLVSSGAIGSGLKELGLKSRPRDVAALQAVAAVGQHRLMTMMREAFEPLGFHVGQLLLTRTDFDDRVRFLNIRNCVTHLQSLKCIPIINENDTVAVDEIRFGDNDLLAALMCNALRADALILLTVVDGLLDGEGKRIDLVRSVTDARSLDRKEKSKLGSGGMTTKLEAARLVTEAGEIAVVANGREPDVLLRILAGEKVGTVFAPAPRKLGSRERWIGLTARPKGGLVIDDGACDALRKGGKSLLAGGIVDVSGSFDEGDLILVSSKSGDGVARGLSNYSSDDVRLIMGKKSSQFEKILGRPAFAEVIHRDNLVIIGA